MVEAPSHLARHTPALRLTMLAALLRLREREITDALVELLIATVHRIDARTQRKVTNELIAEFKRVTGKENLLALDQRCRAHHGRGGRGPGHGSLGRGSIALSG